MMTVLRVSFVYYQYDDSLLRSERGMSTFLVERMSDISWLYDNSFEVADRMKANQPLEPRVSKTKCMSLMSATQMATSLLLLLW